SLHTSVGVAFVGAVVGEYLGSARGVGHLIHQAEGVFDIDTVFAGILGLTIFALILDVIVAQMENRLLVRRPRGAETDAVEVEVLRGGGLQGAFDLRTRWEMMGRWNPFRRSTCSGSSSTSASTAAATRWEIRIWSPKASPHRRAARFVTVPI